jgi:hypothetical protein
VEGCLGPEVPREIDSLEGLEGLELIQAGFQIVVNSGFRVGIGNCQG